MHRLSDASRFNPAPLADEDASRIDGTMLRFHRELWTRVRDFAALHNAASAVTDGNDDFDVDEAQINADWVRGEIITAIWRYFEVIAQLYPNDNFHEAVRRYLCAGVIVKCCNIVRQPPFLCPEMKAPEGDAPLPDESASLHSMRLVPSGRRDRANGD